MQLKKRNQRMFNRIQSIVHCKHCGNPLKVGEDYCSYCNYAVFEELEEGAELLAKKWGAHYKHQN